MIAIFIVIYSIIGIVISTITSRWSWSWFV